MTQPAARPRHIPVLGREVLAWLQPREGGIYVDATFGAGGYSRAILETPQTRVIGIDRDRTAIAGGFDLVDGRMAVSPWSRTASPISRKSARRKA